MATKFYRKTKPRPHRRMLSPQAPRVVLVSNVLHDSIAGFSEAERKGLLRHFRSETAYVGGHLLNFALREREVWLLICLGDSNQELSDKELETRLFWIWPEEKVASWKKALENTENMKERAYMREDVMSSMMDLGHYLRRMFRGVTSLIHQQRKTKGILWKEISKTLSVETEVEALFTVSAYLDFSGLRKGEVERPQDDVFCGFGSAYQGDKQSQGGLIRLLNPQDPPVKQKERREALEKVTERLRLVGYEPNVETAGACADLLSLYEAWLFPKVCTGVISTKNPNRSEVEVLWVDEGQPSLSAFRERDFRFMTHGGAIGGQAFLEQIFEAYRDQFSENRSQISRKIPGNWLGLSTLRFSGSK